MSEIDKTWHLAQTQNEVDIADFELLLWRVFYGFLKWQEDCEHSANNDDLTGHELSILHVIRMKDRPKTISDISRLLNREDTFNITYSIKKLLKMGLIEKTKHSVKKGASYQVTKEGIKNTDAYVKARKHILIDLFMKENDINLSEIIRGLTKIKALYDEAGRLAASYRESN